MALKRAADKDDRAKRRLDFSATQLPSDFTDSFYSFESSPECAAMLYHINSGHELFRKSRDAMDLAALEDRDLTSGELSTIAEEVQAATLSGDETVGVVENFTSMHGKGFGGTSGPDIVGCGMCGVISVDGRNGRKCGEHRLTDLPARVRPVGTAQALRVPLSFAFAG